MSDKVPEFNMDSKIVIAIIAMTVTTVAAIVCTKKFFLDKKQPTSPEKRILRRKQRSMVKALTNIEDDAKKMLGDIKRIQGILLEFLKKNDNEKTIVENDENGVDNNDSIDTDSNEKTIIENEEIKTEEGETKEEESKAEETHKVTSDGGKKNGSEPASIQAIRVDGILIEMKLKGLDEFLLRLLEQLDSLRPNALMDEAREMCEAKEGLDDVIPYIEHKVEKIKKRKKSLVVKIQKYLDNVDILDHTVSGKNKDIGVLESVAKLWEVEDKEEGEVSNDDEKKNN